MPLYSKDPTGKYTFDSWGWSPRGDFIPVSMGGRMLYGISGETYTPEDMNRIDQSPLYDTPDAAWAAFGHNRPTPAPGVNQSENAYNASLANMGISQSELPFGMYGQEMTARIFMKHGIPLPDYLKPWGTPGYGGDPSKSQNQPGQNTPIPSGSGAPPPPAPPAGGTGTTNSGFTQTDPTKVFAGTVRFPDATSGAGTGYTGGGNKNATAPTTTHNTGKTINANPYTQTPGIDAQIQAHPDYHPQSTFTMGMPQLNSPWNPAPPEPPPEDKKKPPPDWNNLDSNPAIGALQAQRTASLATKQQQMLEQKRRALLGFGSRTLAQSALGLDPNDPWLGTISDDPNSSSFLGRLNYAYKGAQRDFNENAGAANLYYGGGRAVGLQDLARTQTNTISDAARQIQDQVGGYGTDYQNAVADWDQIIYNAKKSLYDAQVAAAGQ